MPQIVMLLKIKLKLNYHKFHPRVLAEFNNLENQVVLIDRFGDSEPLKNKFDESISIEKMIDIWEEYWCIMVKNKSDFNLYFQADKSGIITCSGRLQVKSYSDSRIKELIELINSLVENDMLIFGFFIDEETYDMKHKVIDDHSYYWAGTSDQNFKEYLPGIYWYTYFCKELIESMGYDSLSDLKNVNYIHNGQDNVSFMINSLKPGEQLLKEIEIVQDKIGNNFFFSKNSTNDNLFKHTSPFLDYLKSLEF